MDRYPVDLLPEADGAFTVTFPDMPYGVTYGEDEQDALARAVDALETVIIGLMSDRQDIPEPSLPEGRKTVALPALSAAKVALYRAMRSASVRKAELGRRLGWHMPQIDRLFDLRHSSRLDQIAIGKEISIDVRDAV